MIYKKKKGNKGSFCFLVGGGGGPAIYTGDRPKALLNGQRWVPVNFTLGCVLYVEQTAVRDYMRLQSGGDGPNKKKKKKGIGNWWTASKGVFCLFAITSDTLDFGWLGWISVVDGHQIF
jgi:hypothetical protein